MKRILIVAFIIVGMSANAVSQTKETSLKYWFENFLDIYPSREPPRCFTATSPKFRGGASGLSLGNDFPMKLYQNFQRTKYYLADSQLETPTLVFTITTQLAGYKIFGFEEGTCGYTTHVLAIVSSDGTMHDILEVGVRALGADRTVGIFEIKAQEFIITKDNEVITYELVPVDKKGSTSLTNFETVRLYRVDTTYKVSSDGHFWITKYQKYAPKTYTFKELSDENYHICNGNETPVR